MPGAAYHLVFPGHDTGRCDLSGGQQIPQGGRDETESLGIPGLLEFTGHNTREERTAETAGSKDLSVQQATNQCLCTRTFPEAGERTHHKGLAGPVPDAHTEYWPD